MDGWPWPLVWPLPSTHKDSHPLQAVETRPRNAQPIPSPFESSGCPFVQSLEPSHQSPCVRLPPVSRSPGHSSVTSSPISFLDWLSTAPPSSSSGSLCLAPIHFGSVATVRLLESREEVHRRHRRGSSSMAAVASLAPWSPESKCNWLYNIFTTCTNLAQEKNQRAPASIQS